MYSVSERISVLADRLLTRIERLEKTIAFLEQKNKELENELHDSKMSIQKQIDNILNHNLKA